ncbi:MAG: helix-turn-helix transcriptional regulator [Gemmatimonadota bacterium]
MNDLEYITATDPQILEAIGERLRSLRKARGLTQSEAAERAGLGRHTLYRAEHGDNPTLSTLVRLLRVYARLPALDSFIPVTEVSPMARLRKRRARSGEGGSEGANEEAGADDQQVEPPSGPAPGDG